MPFLTVSTNSGGIEPSAYLHKQLDITLDVRSGSVWFSGRDRGPSWFCPNVDHYLVGGFAGSSCFLLAAATACSLSSAAMPFSFNADALPAALFRALKACRFGFQNQLFQTPLPSREISDSFSWVSHLGLSRRKWQSTYPPQHAGR